ncbi:MULTISPECIES: DGQHR domain-containing protein [unclassified Aureimonas]|uniref:DGQHR domain-containing protein n=1 Tax=unclassified Aureimonas TaxID=2615206 RepID=UPI0009E8A680|nr:MULTISPECIES: DGQHR domain-containing protein [unclassified Aureimonas]
MENVVLKVLRVDQPIGQFYIGAIRAEVLESIATVDVRDFVNGHPEDIAGIQRQLSTARVTKIGEYVNFDYATFPTSIVIAVDERAASIEPMAGCEGLYQLTIHGYSGGENEEAITIDRSAFIIDGQHRLAGLGYHKKDRPFEVNVSIFVGVDMADKAEIFSTVNLAQTKVNRSLVYDLFSYAKSPSPFKMAHEVVIALVRDQDGPFYQRIKRLGIATPGIDEKETLSQATVVRGLLRHFPSNPDQERNKGFLGLASRPAPKDSFRQHIFTPFYRNEDPVAVFSIVSNFFAAVRERWPTAWNSSDQGFILNRTNGYNALIRFLQDAYLSKTDTPRIVGQDEFSSVFNTIDLPASTFTTKNFAPGSSGSSALYKTLLQAANL